MLTQKDIDLIEEIIEGKLEEKFNEKLKGLPSKDEFYETTDKILGELKAIREEITTVTHRTSEHSDTLENHEGRIKKLERVTLPI